MLLNVNNTPDNLEYAIVEIVGEKGSSDTIERGLLRGIEKDGGPGDRFIWIVTSQNVVRACNLSYYTILSLETSDGPSKTFVFFMADPNDQKEAKDLVLSTFETLKKIAMPNADDATGLLDVSLFKNVPINFNTITPKATVTKPISKSPVYNTIANNGTDNYYSRKSCGFVPETPKTPEPYAFKRKSKRPTEEALKKMREKLALIDKREFQYELPVIKSEKAPKEEEKEEQPSAKTRQELINEYGGYPFD